MFTRPDRKLAAMVNISIILSPRNVRRIGTNLTEEERTYCCSDEAMLDLGRFFDIVIPRIRWFTCVAATLLVAAVTGAYAYFTEATFTPFLGTPLSAVTVLLLAALTGFVVLAVNEHKTNTRHAKALASLYTAKRFKPYRHYLLPLTPLLHGYFDPTQGVEI